MTPVIPSVPRASFSSTPTPTASSIPAKNKPPATPTAPIASPISPPASTTSPASSRPGTASAIRPIRTITITLTAGQAVADANIGSTNQTSTGGGGGGGGGGGNTGSGIGSIAGLLFNDSNADGAYQSGESVAAARVVYFDTNNNNKLDAGEKSTTTDSLGKYKFSNLAAGNYIVRRVMPTGYRLTTPALGYYAITMNPGQVYVSINFGSKSV